MSNLNHSKLTLCEKQLTCTYVTENRVLISCGDPVNTCVCCLSGTLGGLFSQILQGEDIVRERAIKFLSVKLKTLPEDVMTKEVEDYVFSETKKVCLQHIF